ncbi:hypothetical protein QR680_018853 [Steinernema hermaphroditum]|uniref:Uncharacterized protein n=1 Tax=Steinernema hermaphroditum TaxID=289476 RepID=A0AA39LRD6_9BILA|nr:hypothetical protein QR680_018853 [Steinernema hermaphroditum]
MTADVSREEAKRAKLKSKSRKVAGAPTSSGSKISCCKKKNKKKKRKPLQCSPSRTAFSAHRQTSSATQSKKLKQRLRSKSSKRARRSTPSAKSKTRVKKAPSAARTPAIKMMKKPQQTVQSLQSLPVTSKLFKRKDRPLTPRKGKFSKMPRVTAFNRNTKNADPSYPSESLHVFSVMHGGRMITRWKYKETKPRDGAPQPLAKSKGALLLAKRRMGAHQITRNQNSHSTMSESVSQISARCPLQAKMNIQGDESSYSKEKNASNLFLGPKVSKGLENDRMSLPSINSFSSFQSKVLEKEETKKCNVPSPGKLSTETSVEMPSPRNKGDIQRKDLDEALDACEDSVHRVEATLKGLKTLAGHQLIPGVSDFENKIDSMFVDMDRVLDWIAVLSESADRSQ